MASIERQLLYCGPPSSTVMQDMVVKRVDLFTIAIVPLNRYQIMRVEQSSIGGVDDEDVIFFQCENTKKSINPSFFSAFLTCWEEEAFSKAILSELTFYLSSTHSNDPFKSLMYILQKNKLLSLLDRFDCSPDVIVALRKHSFTLTIKLSSSSFTIEVKGGGGIIFLTEENNVVCLEMEILSILAKFDHLQEGLACLEKYPNHLLIEILSLSTLSTKVLTHNPPSIVEKSLSIPLAGLDDCLPEMECCICCQIWLDQEGPEWFCEGCSFYYHKQCISMSIGLRKLCCPSCDGGIVNIFK